MNRNKNNGLKNFSHSVGQNWYHIVIVPRCRYPVFKIEHQRNLMIQACELVCSNHKIELFSKEVMDDHVHLFIECPPHLSIRKLVQLIKGGTSYYIRKHQPMLKKYKSLWSKGFMYRSVGNVNAERIKDYIENSNNCIIK